MKASLQPDEKVLALKKEQQIIQKFTKALKKQEGLKDGSNDCWDSKKVWSFLKEKKNSLSGLRKIVADEKTSVGRQ